MSSAVNWSCSTFTRSNPCQRHFALCSCNDRSSKLSFVPVWQMGIHLAVPGRRQGELPQSCSCPAQPAEGNCRQSILCCTFAPAHRSGNWHSTCRSCGLADVSATTNCQAPTLGHKSGGRGFPRVLCAARGVQYGPRCFAECCSLGRVGAGHETEDSNDLAPGAQPGKYAFESCLTLTTITFDMDHTNKPRALPEGAAQALNSSAYQVTSTTSGRGP